MKLSRSFLVPLGWLTLSAATFGLGWHLKPHPERPNSVASLTGEAMTSPLGFEMTGRIEASHSGSDSPDVKSSVVLSSDRIATLGKQLRRSTDPIARRTAFGELLAGLTSENALTIREQIAHLKDSDPEFREFHYAWGQVAGLDAVMHGLETDAKDMGPTVAGWASHDPGAAKDWYESLNEKGNRGANQQGMKAALVHGLAIHDPQSAADFVYTLGSSGDRRAKEMMGIVMGKVVQEGGAEQAALWASNLKEGDLRGHALWEAGRAGVREDADATLAWATDLARDDPNAGSLAYGIAEEMGWRDGPKMAEWLASLDRDAAKAAYGPLLGGWTKADPLAASEFVAEMPPSESRDWAIGGMVHSHRWEDPSAAVAWATQLSSAEGREKVMTLAAEAFVKQDPLGAAEWLPTSGLPVATQERLLGRGK